MKFICTNQRACILQDSDRTRYCGIAEKKCGFKEPAEDRQKALRNLLEAAEEMYAYCGPNWANAEQWKAAIDAARKEMGK